MPHEDFNLFSHFGVQFARHGAKELLRTSGDRALTYDQVERRSAEVASALASLGVGPGERVSVQVEKSPEALVLYLACLRAGFVYHPLNMAYKAGELDYFLNDAEPAVVVCDARNEAIIGPLGQRVGAKRVLTLNADGSGALTELAASAGTGFATVPRGRDDLAALLYSSGTTGVPKGIMLTHGNLLSNTETLVSAWGFAPADRLLHALPIFHVHGLFVAVGCVLLAGASMRWLPSFRVEDVVRYLPECTVMMGVPTFYTRLLADPGFTRETAGNVRLFVSGSAPLLDETFAAFEARTGHRILERYGMTETNMNTSNPLAGPRKPGTVGPPLPGVEVRVCDDAGTILGPGEIGNLEVRGPNVFVGYWKMPDKTAEDFSRDGFFRTGDNAVIGEDGYVSIVGRAKDMVITGGLNVYPKEVERVIDDLAGVRESAVIGVPHPDLGEAVVAVVVAATAGGAGRAAASDGAAAGGSGAAAGGNGAAAGGDRRAARSTGPTEARIIDGCKRKLAGFKAPKRVVFVEALPRNTMAKVQKNVLRERFATLFDAAAGIES